MLRAFFLRPKAIGLWLAASALFLPARSSAINISLEYLNPADAFFTTAAKNTLAKAASDLSLAITTTLAPLNQDIYTGTFGSTNFSADWRLSYTHPYSGLVTNVTTFDFEENEFRIFIGRRSLVASTLGQGGPSGAGLSLSGSGNGTQLAGSVAALESASDNGMLRDGPGLGQLTGNLTLGVFTEPYTLSYGYAIGSMTFSDSAIWHKDHTTNPAPGTNDLYSVALHEMLHAIGFSSSPAWQSQVSGTTWLGASVAALRGTGLNALTLDGDHVANGLTGRPFVNGAFLETSQEALMDPDLTQGTRKFLTDLDLAFLEDIGWTVIPEPSPLWLFALAGGLVFFRPRTCEKTQKA